MTILREYPRPRDPAAKEHVGQFDRTIWSDQATGFVIGALKDGVTVKGSAEDAVLQRGQMYRFLGRWTEDAKRGWQFVFSTYAMQEPAGRAGVLRYLTHLCDGIGEKRAAALYDRYGGEAVKTLRLEPARVVADGLLTADVAKEAADALAEAADLEATKLALFDLFAGRGFWADALIKECVRKWGAKAPDVVRRNPFALMVAEMPSAGFKRADKLYLDLGHPPLRLKRQMLAGWHAIHSDTTGHTWQPIDAAARAVKEAVGDGHDAVRAVKLGIRAKWLRHHRDAAGKLWLAEADRAINEQAIATQIVRLTRGVSVEWPVVGELDGRGPSPHQREKLRLATAAPVGILTGTPGTGKTYSAAYLIQAIMDLHGGDDIGVVAPTGKAAVRITQAIKAAGISLVAMTMHRALGLGKASGAKGERPQFNEWRPLPWRWIVLEEASMADTDILAHLLRACAVGTHVLILGDPWQLPPVGHGAPLRDLIAAGVPCGELSEIRRNAGLIVHACAAIKGGGTFKTATRYDAATGDNLRVVDTNGPAETLDSLSGLLEKLRASGPFDPVWQTQVIVGVNEKGELSRKALNDRLQAQLNPDGVTVAPNPFRVGDKIICLKNQFLAGVRLADDVGADPMNVASYTEARGRDGAKSEVYVANGEIGRVEAVAEKVTVARFSEGDQAVRIPMGKARPAGAQDDEKDGAGGSEDKGRGGMFDLGYAITCHKAQGSEAPCVIVIVDENAGQVANREWHYTAVSRASKLCVILGPTAVMHKQIRRVALKRRKTFLVDLVQEGMAACQPMNH